MTQIFHHYKISGFSVIHSQKNPTDCVAVKLAFGTQRIDDDDVHNPRTSVPRLPDQFCTPLQQQ